MGEVGFSVQYDSQKTHGWVQVQAVFRGSCGAAASIMADSFVTGRYHLIAGEINGNHEA